MKTVHNYEPFRKNQPINESVHKTFRAGRAFVHTSVLSNAQAVFKRFDIQGSLSVVERVCASYVAARSWWSRNGLGGIQDLQG